VSIFCIYYYYSPLETSENEMLLSLNQILNWDWCNEEEARVKRSNLFTIRLGVSVREIRKTCCRQPSGDWKLRHWYSGDLCASASTRRVTWWRTACHSVSLRSVSFATSPMRSKAAKGTAVYLELHLWHGSFYQRYKITCSAHSKPLHEMQMCRQVYASAALPPGIEPWVPIG
jgi:hypothetical protein